MAFSLIPDYKYNSIYDITPDILKKNGISLLILDLDNTISPYKTDVATKEAISWVNSLKNNGIKLFIVSNNKGDRPEIFSNQLGVPYLKRAKKPSPKKVLEALKIEKTSPSNAALVGDQIYTDVIAANLAGITSFLVHPIKFTNVFLRIRYFFELPFRRGKKKRGF
jgi:hypothetical protein